MWQSKGLSNENIDPPTTSLSLSINCVGNKIKVKFTGSCLKQANKLAYTHGKVVNIYIVYELGASSSNVNDLTLKNCLFGAVTLTKNVDIDKYGYSGYGIGIDGRGLFSFPSGGFGQNVSIFGVDMSFSAQIDNKKKDITAEKMYSINFTATKKKFCLSLHYNGANSYLFVNGTKIYKFKAKDSEIVATPLFRKYFKRLVNRLYEKKKTGLNGYVYDFSVDSDSTDVDDIKDIHKYLMKKKIVRV